MYFLSVLSAEIAIEVLDVSPRASLSLICFSKLQNHHLPEAFGDTFGLCLSDNDLHETHLNISRPFLPTPSLDAALGKCQ